MFIQIKCNITHKKKTIRDKTKIKTNINLLFFTDFTHNIVESSIINIVLQLRKSFIDNPFQSINKLIPIIHIDLTSTKNNIFLKKHHNFNIFKYKMQIFESTYMHYLCLLFQSLSNENKEDIIQKTSNIFSML